MVGIAQLVEQQVVVLEVEGSSPSIYPISNLDLEIIIKKPTKIYNIKLLQLISFIYSNLNFSHKLTAIRSFQYIHLLIPTTFYNKSFFYKNSYASKITKNCNSINFKKFSNINNTSKNHNIFRLFSRFLLVSYYQPNNNIKQHQAFRFAYYSRSSKVLILNLQKTFVFWKNFYYLIFNLFYYDLRLVTFSNPFFLREASTLNWFFNKHLLNTFKFSYPFMFFKMSHIVNYGNIFFRKMRYYNINTSIVLDSLYHSKTLFYLKNNNFFNISVVTPSSFSRLVDIYLPVTSNSLFVQLFVIRYLLIIKKTTNSHSFKEKKKLWNLLISHFN